MASPPKRIAYFDFMFCDIGHLFGRPLRDQELHDLEEKQKEQEGEALASGQPSVSDNPIASQNVSDQTKRKFRKKCVICPALPSPKCCRRKIQVQQRLSRMSIDSRQTNDSYHVGAINPACSQAASHRSSKIYYEREPDVLKAKIAFEDLPMLPLSHLAEDGGQAEFNATQMKKSTAKPGNLSEPEEPVKSSNFRTITFFGTHENRMLIVAAFIIQCANLAGQTFVLISLYHLLQVFDTCGYVRKYYNSTISAGVNQAPTRQMIYDYQDAFLLPRSLTVGDECLKSSYERESYWQWGGIIVASVLLVGITSNLVLHLMSNLGQRMKAFTICSVYEKVLRSRQVDINPGEVLNIISTDAGKWVETAPWVQQIWSVPVWLVITSYMLFLILGPATAGMTVGILLIATVLNMWLSRLSASAKKRRVALTEQRILLCNELISGIRIVKFFAWEESYIRRIKEVRRMELNESTKETMLMATKLLFLNASPALASILALLLYENVQTAIYGTGHINAKPLSTCASFMLFNVIYKMSFPIMQLSNVFGSVFNLLSVQARVNAFLALADDNPHKPEQRLLELENGDGPGRDSGSSFSSANSANNMSRNSVGGKNASFTSLGVNASTSVLASTSQVPEEENDERQPLLDSINVEHMATHQMDVLLTPTAAPAKKPLMQRTRTLGQITDRVEKLPRKHRVLVSLQKAAIGWKGQYTVLKDITIDMLRGETFIIMGRVGAGKSTLLKALIGEADLMSGIMRYPLAGRPTMREVSEGAMRGIAAESAGSTGRGPKGHATSAEAVQKANPRMGVCYVSQQAFVFAGTVQENILFYREFDEKKYLQCIDMSNMLNDIENQFAYGDQTQIAERGGNLSGGQRMRLALARSLYDFDDTDVFLFDDIFAALDNRTGFLICDKLMSRKRSHQLYIFTANKDMWSNAFSVKIPYDNPTIGSLTKLRIDAHEQTLVPLEQEVSKEEIQDLVRAMTVPNTPVPLQMEQSSLGFSNIGVPTLPSQNPTHMSFGANNNSVGQSLVGETTIVDDPNASQHPGGQTPILIEDVLAKLAGDDSTYQQMLQHIDSSHPGGAGTNQSANIHKLPPLILEGDKPALPPADDHSLANVLSGMARSRRPVVDDLFGSVGDVIPENSVDHLIHHATPMTGVVEGDHFTIADTIIAPHTETMEGHSVLPEIPEDQVYVPENDDVNKGLKFESTLGIGGSDPNGFASPNSVATETSGTGTSSATGIGSKDFSKVPGGSGPSGAQESPYAPEQGSIMALRDDDKDHITVRDDITVPSEFGQSIPFGSDGDGDNLEDSDGEEEEEEGRKAEDTNLSNREAATTMLSGIAPIGMLGSGPVIDYYSHATESITDTSLLIKGLGRGQSVHTADLSKLEHTESILRSLPIRTDEAISELHASISVGRHSHYSQSPLVTPHAMTRTSMTSHHSSGHGPLSSFNSSHHHQGNHGITPSRAQNYMLGDPHLDQMFGEAKKGITLNMMTRARDAIPRQISRATSTESLQSLQSIKDSTKAQVRILDPSTRSGHKQLVLHRTQSMLSRSASLQSGGTAVGSFFKTESVGSVRSVNAFGTHETNEPESPTSDGESHVLASPKSKPASPTRIPKVRRSVLAKAKKDPKKKKEEGQGAILAAYLAAMSYREPADPVPADAAGTKASMKASTMKASTTKASMRASMKASSSSGYEIPIGCMMLPFIIWQVLFLVEKVAAVMGDIGMGWWQDNKDSNSDFYVFIVSYVIMVSLVITNRLWFPVLAKAASSKLFNEMLGSVVRAPIHYFDTTPVGTLLGRFSFDIDVVDSLMPLNFFPMMMYLTWIIGGVLMLCCRIFPWYLAIILPIWICLLIVLLLPARRRIAEIQALDNSGTILALVNETCQGSHSIRVFERQGVYMNLMCYLVNKNSRVTHSSELSTRWLGIRVELIGSLYWIGIVLSCMLSDIEATNAAVAFGWTQNMSECIIWSYIFYILSESSLSSIDGIRKMGPKFMQRDGFHSDLDALHVQQELCDQLAADAKAMGNSPAVYPTIEGAETAGTENLNGTEKQGLLIRNLMMKYRKDLPNFVLNGLTVHIMPGERCAVVGRTGAGKSSIAVAVFNLGEEIHGQIFLNGRNLLNPVPVNKSRRRLGIITQDPVIFSGTVRYNLDPFGEFSDKECEDALRAACLRNVDDEEERKEEEVIAAMRKMEQAGMPMSPTANVLVGVQQPEDEDGNRLQLQSGSSRVASSASNPTAGSDPGFMRTNTFKLRHKERNANVVKHYDLVNQMEASGANLSIGERQLLCLARVMLRNPEMLVCDEATASCDLETDAQVQQAIRNWLKGKNCCVLTIAHRLETIADYEKILFLDKGTVCEYASPQELLSSETNFSDLVKAAGEDTEKRVREIVFNKE